MEGIEEDFIKEWLDDTPYIKVRTSGSTGEPKLIELSKQTLLRSARRTNSFFGLGAGSHFHSCISPEFIGGKMMIVRSLIADAHFTSETPSNRPLEGRETLSPIDLLAVVPSQMWSILSKEYPVPEIRNIIIGGAPIPAPLREALIRSGMSAWETYGMTETASHIALRKIADGIDCFTTLPGITVTTDHRECLVIDMEDRKIVTNDVALLHSPTEFQIAGRVDNMIITGGKKLNPLEIEEQLRKLTEARCYVSSIKDELWGEKTIVVIDESDPGSLSFKENWKRIRTEMRQFLPSWKIPKGYVAVSSFSYTPTGKLVRRKFT